MIVLGLYHYGTPNSNAFDTQVDCSNVNFVSIYNIKADELEIRSKTDIPFTTTKSTWKSDFLLDAKFQNILEAGSISLSGLEISELRFKKRKVSDLTWNEFYRVNFTDVDAIYEIMDYLVSTGEEYEYACVPFGSVEGQYTSDKIYVEFDSCFILDKTNNFRLCYNLELGDLSTVTQSSTIETLGSQYPLIVYNGNLKYKKGSIKCLLLSDNYANTGLIDIRQEKLYRQNIYDFLINKKPKVLKDGTGNFMLVNIIGEPHLSYRNDVNLGIYDVSFDFVEIADANSVQDLQSYGII